MTELIVRVDSLGWEHLGSTIVYPVGLETAELFLTGLTFRRRGSVVRVILTGPTPSEYADLAAYAKVTVAGSRP